MNAGMTLYNPVPLFHAHKIERTYYVPTTLFVFARSSFSKKILAMPKSDIFGIM